jgi:DNA-binding response OmpR family regulator
LKKARILWVEGKRADSPSFLPNLRKKDLIVETVPTGSEALDRLFEVDPDLVVINAASMRSNGRRICRSLREKINGLPIIVITAPDQTFTDETCANAVLALPFTVRKLMNRIAPFIPDEESQMLHVGPIRLNLEKKQVFCQGRESHLTPRLVNLLQLLMLHHGELLRREDLFREIWRTEYTGDTRTLDVHISWLRQAIEDDPRQPRFLKTIRRMGYRLDV